MSIKTIVLLIGLLLTAGSCSEADVAINPVPVEQTKKTGSLEELKNPGRVVHVFVALCDNENQGIVPVPSHLGNGEDPDRNLYWGAAYGVHVFFEKQKMEDARQVREPKAKCAGANCI